jgi:hypothetical protein
MILREISTRNRPERALGHGQKISKIRNFLLGAVERKRLRATYAIEMLIVYLDASRVRVAACVVCRSTPPHSNAGLLVSRTAGNHSLTITRQDAEQRPLATVRNPWAIMPYSLATAAAAAGINKSTVFRAIKGGRISAQRDETGQWQIDPAEFHRVFPPLPAPATATQQAAQHDAITNMLISELQSVISDLRRDRDHWRTAFEGAQRLLSSPTQQDAAAEQPPRNRRSWWLRRAWGLHWLTDEPGRTLWGSVKHPRPNDNQGRLGVYADVGRLERIGPPERFLYRQERACPVLGVNFDV